MSTDVCGLETAEDLPPSSQKYDFFYKSICPKHFGLLKFGDNVLKGLELLGLVDVIKR